MRIWVLLTVLAGSSVTQEAEVTGSDATTEGAQGTAVAAAAGETASGESDEPLQEVPSGSASVMWWPEFVRSRGPAESLANSLDDTSATLASFYALRNSSAFVAGFADFNLDGLADVIFLDENRTVVSHDTEANVTTGRRRADLFTHELGMVVACASSGSQGFQICFNETLKHPSTLKTQSNDSWDGFRLLGMLPGDFLVNQRFSAILIWINPTTRLTKYALYAGNASSYGVPLWVTTTADAGSGVPIVIDINRDGYPDLLGNGRDEHEGRVVWINDRHGKFEKTLWSRLDSWIDLDHYSTLPKLDIDWNELVDLVQSGAKTVAAMEVQQPTETAGGILDFVKQIWQKVGLISTNADEASNKDKAEAAYLQRHEADLLMASGPPGVKNWGPRPLPLRDSTWIADVVGHGLYDVNGDCVADLVLAVQSPDFEDRIEIEIWLTEAADDGTVKWRQWRAQRVLLPEGTQSIAVDDATGNGGTDLLVLACDPMLRPVQDPKNFDEYRTSPMCSGAERVFLFKAYQPPLCVSPQLQPPLKDRTLCRPVDRQCATRPFVFGGIDEGFRRIGMSVSDLRFPGELTPVHLVSSSPRFPVVMQLADIDRDGFSDILLLVNKQSSDPDEFWPHYRVMRSVPPLGDGPQQRNFEDTWTAASKAFQWSNETSTMDNLKAAFHRLWQVSKMAMGSMWDRLIGAERLRREPLRARRFEAVDEIRMSGLAYAGGFIEDAQSPGTVDFLAFTDPMSGRSAVHLFRRADTNFFVAATALDVPSTPPSPNQEGTSERQGQPIIGSTFALVVTGMDGVKYPVRKTLGFRGGVYGALYPRATYVGLGQSSNYIESLFCGLPYIHGPAEDLMPKTDLVLDQEHSSLPLNISIADGVQEMTSIGKRLAGVAVAAEEDQTPLDSFYRRWIGLLPNSQMTIIPSQPRWKPRLWSLILSVSPGRQAFVIVLGTIICLAFVGAIILLLDQQEKAAIARKQHGFRKHFVAV